MRATSARTRPFPAARWAFLLAAIVVVAGTFRELIGWDRTPLYRDLLFFFLPLKWFLAESLRSGELPLWNPWIFLGTPFLASLQTGVLYPPSVLLILPFPLGLNAFYLFHYLVALLGTFVWLSERRTSAAAAAVGAITFTLGGYLVSSLNVANHLQSAAWVPWVLFAAQRVYGDPSLRRVTALAVALSLLVLGGAPEIAFMTGGMVSAHMLWTAATGREGFRTCFLRSLAIAGAVALALGLTAFQILPTAELIGRSVRAAGLDFDSVSRWSLTPVSLLQLLFPRSNSLVSPEGVGHLGPHLTAEVPWLTSLYVGAVPLCLAAGGFLRTRDRALWIGMGVLGTLLALGSHTPLFRILFDLAPSLLARFRYPEKFWFLTHVGLVVLAAHGLEHVLRRDRVARRAVLGALVTLGGVAGGLMLIRAVWPVELVTWMASLPVPGRDRIIVGASLATDFVFKAERLLLMLCGLLALLVGHARGRLSPQLVGSCVFLIVSADLYAAHRGLNLSVRWADLTSASAIASVDELRDNRWRVFTAQTRKVAPGSPATPVAGFDDLRDWAPPGMSVEQVSLERWRALWVNAPMVHSVRAFSGGEAIIRKETMFARAVVATLPRAESIDLLRLFSVREIVTADNVDVDSVRLVRQGGSHRVYRIRDPVPAVYVADRLLTASDEIEAINMMISNDFRQGRDAIVESKPSEWTDSGTSAEPGSARIVIDRPDLVAIDVDAASQSLVVLNDSFDPDWVATIDGVGAPIMRTNLLVRGIVTPPGLHRIRLEYRPWSFRVGATISLGALILCCTFLLSRVGRARRSTVESPPG